MGQLNNLYVSSSFQGLLKMTDSSNGLTNSLQTIQTGDGDNSPLQMSLTQVNISGSFFINNVPITNGTNGTSGTSGTSGSNGSDGSSGTSGTDGSTGSSGSDGSSGTSGSNGTDGSSGTSGSNGSDGSSGTSGSNGTDGTSGTSTSIDTGSFATTGSNVFVGKQIITGSNGTLIYDGTISSPNLTLAEVHANDATPWLERFYNDSFSTSSSVMSYFAWDDGRFIFHNDSTQSISISVDGYENDNLLVGDTTTISNNDLIVSGTIKTNGAITFSESAFNSTTNVSGALYFSSLNNGTLHLNDDGGEGDVFIGWGPNNTHIRGNTDITGSLGVTNIKGTGSLFLQPDQSDVRFVEIYNTSPTDTHITASGGQIFLGDDVTYVKVDNYGSVERIDIVAGNELVVSSSVINLSGSLHQSGTFYPDVIDWVSSSIQQGTGSYVLTTDLEGVTQYDTYANIATALSPFINSNRDGLITTGSLYDTTEQSITGALYISGAYGFNVGSGYNNDDTFNGVSLQQNDYSSFFIVNNPNYAQLNLIVKDNPDYTYENNFNIVVSSGSIKFQEYNQDRDYSYRDWLQVQASTSGTSGIKPIQLLRNTEITGSLRVSGNITANSASFNYLQTVYETASIIYSSGSNQFGDASNDTQTLWGTIKIPTGPVDITGSLYVSSSIQKDVIVDGQIWVSSSLTTATTSTTQPQVNVAGYTSGTRRGTSKVGPGNITLYQSSSVSGDGTAIIAVTGLAVTNNNSFSSQFYAEGIGSSNTMNYVEYKGIYNLDGTIDVEQGLEITSSGSLFQDWDNSGFDYSTYMSLAPNNGNNPAPQMLRGLGVTGSVSISGLLNVSQNISIASGTFNLNNNGQSSISNPASGRNVLYVDNDYSNFFFGNVPKAQSGRFSGDTGNFIVSPTYASFETGSNNILLATGNSNLISGSNNTIIGGAPNFGTSNYQNSLYISSGDFKLQRNGSGSPFQIGESTQVTGSLRVSNGSTITGSLTVTGSLTTSTGITIDNKLSISNGRNSILENIAIGSGSLASITTGDANTAIGDRNLRYITNGSSNTAVGTSLTQLVYGFSNTAIGYLANTNLESGLYNTAVGAGALLSPYTGSNNTAVGSSAGGSANIDGGVYLGYRAGNGSTGSNVLVIDNQGRGSNDAVVTGSLIVGTFDANPSNQTLRINASTTISGSNTFIGNTTITGSVLISGSAAVDLIVTGAAVITTQDALARLVMAPASFNINSTKTEATPAEGYIFGPTGSDAQFYLGVYDDPNFTTDVELNIKVDSNGISFNDWDNGNTFTYTPFLTLSPNVGNSPIPQFTRGLGVTGSLKVSGNVMFASGSNKTMGTAVLNGGNPGTATVSNSLVTTSSLIFLTKQTLTNAHMVAVSSKGSGTFTITSNGNGDADTVAYQIINPA